MPGRPPHSPPGRIGLRKFRVVPSIYRGKPSFTLQKRFLLFFWMSDYELDTEEEAKAILTHLEKAPRYYDS